MAFTVPYETTIGTMTRKNDLDNITNGLAISILEGDLLNITPLLYCVKANDKVTKIFTHPLLVSNQATKKSAFVIDVRHTMKRAEMSYQNTHVIYEVCRCTLMANDWLDTDHMIKNKLELSAQRRTLLNMSSLPLKLFIHYIGDSLINRMGIDVQYKERIKVILACYYVAQFAEYDFTNETNLMDIARRLNSVISVDAVYILRFLKEMVDIDFTSINGLVSTLQKNVDSARLDGLNSGLLITHLGGIWFGFNAAQHVAVALEHPPTWMAMIYASLTTPQGSNGMYEFIRRNKTFKEGAKSYVETMDRYLKGHDVDMQSKSL